MDVLLFYVRFNSISVIPGQKEGDNERLLTMELRLRVKKIPTSERESNLGPLYQQASA